MILSWEYALVVNAMDAKLRMRNVFFIWPSPFPDIPSILHRAAWPEPIIEPPFG
jgi:hypothetical protein